MDTNIFLLSFLIVSSKCANIFLKIEKGVENVVCKFNESCEIFTLLQIER